MISVTRLNGSPMWLNALMVEIVEETPDTYITLVTGKRLIVLEKANEVISKIKDYNREIGVQAATIKVQQTEES
ncbi:flagellar FlbD family protein [Paenibacillus taichungensis]|uniref:flagellar FlbD family protein n=1 Tax=Paenibacillus TaxID=44249 RepID=UPI002230B60E|nr:flagellar FlbD family protein [Paenibacillus sp. LS1]MCW3792189.1 flagellar FlbD family protein [Paenibacillus sp. LS1]